MANPELELQRIEREFTRAATKRRPSVTLRNLSAGRIINVSHMQVSKESRTHAVEIANLLRIIDRYATKHAQLRGRAVLPNNMAKELEALARRQKVNLHEKLPKLVSRAMDTHRRRLIKLFEKAEQLRAKHGLAIVTSRRLGA